MSGASKKKIRKETEAQRSASKEQKRQEAQQKERRTMRLYAVVGVVLAVLAVFLVVWQSGVIQGGSAALTVKGVKYGPADVQYYYNTVVSQSGMSAYSSSFETTIMDQETGQTMKDYLMEQAVDTMVTVTALADKAKAEGYTLSQGAQASLDDALQSLEDSWAAAGFASRDAFLKANFGPYMTYDRVKVLMEQQALVGDYTAAALEAMAYSEDDYADYYRENRDALDSYTITQYVFRAEAPAAAEGEERTEEQSAALLEEAKAEKKAQAEELLAKLKAGEDAEQLAEEYSEELFSSELSAVSLGQSSSTYGMSGINSSYSAWAMEAGRKAGDITLSEYDAGTAYVYYVVRFEGREQDNSPINNVRHILVSGDGAQEKAAALLEQWKAGEATEESFAALAMTESEDTGSAADGGLIYNVSPTSAYVESFRDWGSDPSRKAGDTGLVESTYGWHVMYYTPGEPLWKTIALDALRNADYLTWRDTAREGYEAVPGSGMKYVQ